MADNYNIFNAYSRSIGDTYLSLILTIAFIQPSLIVWFVPFFGQDLLFVLVFHVSVREGDRGNFGIIVVVRQRSDFFFLVFASLLAESRWKELTFSSNVIAASRRIFYVNNFSAFEAVIDGNRVFTVDLIMAKKHGRAGF